MADLDAALAVAGLQRDMDKIGKYDKSNGFIMVGDDKIYVEDFDPEVHLGNSGLKDAWDAWKTAISKSTWQSEWHYVSGENSDVQENIKTWALLVAAEQMPAVKYTGEIDDSVEPPIRVTCLLYTSPSPRDRQKSRMPSSA